jgi:hypothetical protein
MKDTLKISNLQVAFLTNRNFEINIMQPHDSVYVGKQLTKIKFFV